MGKARRTARAAPCSPEDVMPTALATSTTPRLITAAIDEASEWSSSGPRVAAALRLVFGEHYVTSSAYRPRGRAAAIALDIAHASVCARVDDLADDEEPGAIDGYDFVF